MLLKIYKQIEKGHKNEIKIIYILSFASTGLFHSDLNHIKILNHYIESDHCMNFGDWDHFINCAILNKEEEMHGQFGHCSQSHKHMEFTFLTESHIDTLQSSKLIVNSIITNNIRSEALGDGKCVDYARQYLCYMSLLSRILLRHIKTYKLQEFDPAILSTQIDDGIWSMNDNLNMSIRIL